MMQLIVESESLSCITKSETLIDNIIGFRKLFLFKKPIFYSKNNNNLKGIKRIMKKLLLEKYFYARKKLSIQKKNVNQTDNQQPVTETDN